MLVQVQAHVATTEVDPGAAVAWLRVTDTGMEASPTGSQLIRSVLQRQSSCLTAATLKAYPSAVLNRTSSSSAEPFSGIGHPFSVSL